jgi:hypothetical protein
MRLLLTQIRETGLLDKHNETHILQNRRDRHKVIKGVIERKKLELGSEYNSADEEALSNTASDESDWDIGSSTDSEMIYED